MSNDNPYSPPAAVPSALPIADQYWVRRSYGALLRRTCEVGDETGVVATLVSRLFRNCGVITSAGQSYDIDLRTMSLGTERVATYRIIDRFLRTPIVEITDFASRRMFRLRRRAVWSMNLTLWEDESRVGEFLSNPVTWSSRIRLRTDVPQSVILLAAWATVIRRAFIA